MRSQKSKLALALLCGVFVMHSAIAMGESEESAQVRWMQSACNLGDSVANGFKSARQWVQENSKTAVLVSAAGLVSGGIYYAGYTPCYIWNHHVPSGEVVRGVLGRTQEDVAALWAMRPSTQVCVDAMGKHALSMAARSVVSAAAVAAKSALFATAVAVKIVASAAWDAIPSYQRTDGADLDDDKSNQENNRKQKRILVNGILLPIKKHNGDVIED